jgi:hypothetical protein
MNASQNKLVWTNTHTTFVKLRQSFERRNEKKLRQQQICMKCHGHCRYNVYSFTVMYKPVHRVPRACVKKVLVVIDGLYCNCEAKNFESRLKIETKLNSTVVCLSLKLLSTVMTLTYIYLRFTEYKWEIREITPHYSTLFTKKLHLRYFAYIGQVA